MSSYYVYILSDACGDTLYVGHTKDADRRIREHRRSKWGDRITDEFVEAFACKEDATAMERTYILDLEPEFNVHGNPGLRCCELCHPQGGAA